ncbi:MAG: hypothetical protein ACYDAO_04745 [Thermoplasmataceae archaeon]
MAFAIPVIIILGTSIAMSIGKSKTKIDSAPTLAQGKEQFKVPASSFNREMKFVEDENIGHFFTEIEKDMEKIDDIMKRYKRLIKLYKKFDAQTKSFSERRSERAIEKRDIVFKDIVEIYRYIEKLKMRGFAYGDKGKQA